MFPATSSQSHAKFVFDFVTSFDAADLLVLCEIYEVAGRDEDKDKEISSRDLLEAIVRHDADRGVTRTVEYAPNPAESVKRTMEIISPKDVVIFMGAGGYRRGNTKGIGYD